jgi:hypothetical protein
MPVSQFHVLCGLMNGKGSEHATLKRMRDAPKFVFSPEVTDFINHHQDDYEDALNTAVRAGHTELSHDPMLVEWSNKTIKEQSYRMFWLVAGGTGGRYRVSSATICDDRPGVLDGYLPIELNGKQWRAGKFVGDARVPTDDDDEALYNFERAACTAVFYAMALHVRGIITVQPRPVDPKLDRARRKRGLPPITKDYVTVHIGYVTDRNGKRHAYQEGMGGHVRVHLRRGHTRNQVCGRGLKDHKEVWIPSVLVNYRPGAIVADANYLVVP